MSAEIHAQDDSTRHDPVHACFLSSQDPVIIRTRSTCSGLERRLRSRMPRQRGEGVPEGRSNLKPSEEEFWHAAGVYDSQPATSDAAVAPGEAMCGETEPDRKGRK